LFNGRDALNALKSFYLAESANGFRNIKKEFKASNECTVNTYLRQNI